MKSKHIEGHNILIASNQLSCLGKAVDFSLSILLVIIYTIKLERYKCGSGVVNCTVNIEFPYLNFAYLNT